MAAEKPTSRVTLKELAQHLSLSPGTVSAVLNDIPSARISQKTKERVLSAARELNYLPNYFARSLRNRRTHTIGVIAEELGDAYGSAVISGMEKFLRSRNYCFLTVIHRHDPVLLTRYAEMLIERGVEGFLTVDTRLPEAPSIPTVAVAGHHDLKNVTNVILDHDHCARVALVHLKELGHKQIAFMRGHVKSSDSADRWAAILKVASELDISIDPDLVIQITSLDSTAQLGYPFAKELLSRGKTFTALFAYNDISALGAIRAFREEGLRVPEDISVIGVDDIQGAAFQVPSLTTVRQPLEQMGVIAAEILINRIESSKKFDRNVAIKPELVVRESTGPAKPNVH